MIFDYGFSVRGKSHIATKTCCQDSHMIKKLENGWFVAAVADGVGSAKNSHIGSRIAVQTAVDFCCEYMPWDYNLISIKSMLRTAYNYAYKQILRESERIKEGIESFDTTLTLAIYDGNRIIYGHSGDGAIIALNTFGDFVEITRTQKGEDGVSVIPLRGGYTSWVIDAYEEDLCAVLLMTDGVLDTLCPYLLKDTEKGKNKVYVPLGAFFASPKAIIENEQSLMNLRREMEQFITSDESYDSNRFYNRLVEIYEKHVGENAKLFIEELKKNNYCNVLMQKQQDDKTIVGLINTKAISDNKQPEFYAEPNWEELQEAWNMKAYPHLYNQNTQESEEKESSGVKLGVNTAATSGKDNFQGEQVNSANTGTATEDNKGNGADDGPVYGTAKSSAVNVNSKGTVLYDTASAEEITVPEFMDMKVKTISQIEQQIKIQQTNSDINTSKQQSGLYSLKKDELDEINKIINNDIERKTSEKPVLKKKTLAEKIGEFFE